MKFRSNAMKTLQYFHERFLSLALSISDFQKNLTSLMQNGYALILSTLIASGLGMVFWAVAARQLSAESMGIAAALVSALSTLSHAAQLSLRNLLYRFVPASGRHARTILRAAYILAASAALMLGIGFTQLAGIMAPDLAFINTSVWLQIAFILSLIVWTLYSLQEAAVTSLRLAKMIPVQTLIYSAFKICFLISFIAIWPTSISVLLSWTVPALFVGLIMNYLIQPHLMVFDSKCDVESTAPSKKHIGGFFGWDYVGSLSTSITLGAVPFLIIAVSGAAELAPYFIAWSITYLLYLAGRHLGSAMLAELSVSPNARLQLYAQTFAYTLAPVTLGAITLIILANPVMSIFGAHYAAKGSQTLQLLAIASIPGSTITVFLAICRAQDWLRAIAAIQLATLVGVLGTGFLLTENFGSTGMAAAWLCTQLLLSTITLTVVGRKFGRTRSLSFLIDLASSCNTMTKTFIKILFAAVPRPSKERLESLFINGNEWQIVKVLTSLSDATTMVLNQSTPNGSAMAVLKTAKSEQGKLALQAEYTVLAAYARATATEKNYLVPKPEIIAYVENKDEFRLLMTKLEGVDGRDLAKDIHAKQKMLALAAELINSKMTSNAATVAPSLRWQELWIDLPVARLENASQEDIFKSSMLKSTQRLRRELRNFWTNAEVPASFHHGDYCLDNILFNINKEGLPTQITGLVDWGRASDTGPLGLDLCNLIITTRMKISGQQFGQVALDLFQNPVWHNDEAKLFKDRNPNYGRFLDPKVVRAMTIHAWLLHVDANIEKSSRYTFGSFWWFANVTFFLTGVCKSQWLGPTKNVDEHEHEHEHEQL